jgi:hypothetical protein
MHFLAAVFGGTVVLDKPIRLFPAVLAPAAARNRFRGWFERHRDFLLAALYFVFATALFFRGPLVGGSHIPYDFVVQHYPWSHFITWSLRTTGQLPWWNPYTLMGEPFAGNIQAAIFYPPKLLLIAVTAWLGRDLSLWSLEVLFLLHIAWGGLGAYRLLRQQGTTFSAGILGGTIFALGAPTACFAEHMGLLTSAAWLPWFLVALCRMERRRDLASIAPAGLTAALMILAGHPPAFLPSLVLGSLVYLIWAWQQHKEHARAAGLLIAALALAALLSAVAWLPAHQVQQHSITMQTEKSAMEGLPLVAATSFFWPNLFGQLRGEYWLLSENPIFVHVYQSIAGLLLVMGGACLLLRSNRARPFLAAAGVAGLWMFGQNFFVSQLVYYLSPRGIAGGFHAQYVLSHFTLFFAILSALALDAYTRGIQDEIFPAKYCALGAGVALALALGIVAASGFAPGNSPLVARAGQAAGSLLVIMLMLGGCAVILRNHAGAHPAARARIAGSLCALVLFDLIVVGSGSRLNAGDGNGMPASSVRTKLEERLRRYLPLARIDTVNMPYDWQTRLPQWRMSSLNGHNPLMLKDTVEYGSRFQAFNNRQFEALTKPDSPLLNLAGVGYFITNQDQLANFQVANREDVNLFYNARAFPRFFLVDSVKGVANSKAALDVIESGAVDPAKTVLVSQADAFALHPAGLGGVVQVVSYQPNEIRLDVSAAADTVLVGSEVYWPDWRVEIDGRPGRLLRADAIFRAVAVPAGRHQVRMWISPVYLYWGMALTALGLLAAWLLLI